MSNESNGIRFDVGCGNGAFTAIVADRCAPASVTGIDPEPAQLTFARTRPWPCPTEFREGTAMALPFAADAFAVAVMPLVIFFVPDPAAGVHEMARVVRPGGCVCAYSWDLTGGGFPYELPQQELRAWRSGTRPDTQRARRLPDAPARATSGRHKRTHHLQRPCHRDRGPRTPLGSIEAEVSPLLTASGAA
jgi:SAM-dependent methyltransferase